MGKGKPMNPEVQAFIDHYFLPLAKSPDEFANQAKIRYVSRERLLLAKVALSPPIPGIGSDMILKHERFIDKTYDGFVHGYFESTMDLWNPAKRAFEVQGRSDEEVRADYVEATILKSQEVVKAIELTACMTGCNEVFESARSARRHLDELGLSVDPRKKQK
jgi:hypothetical protein